MPSFDQHMILTKKLPKTTKEKKRLNTKTQTKGKRHLWHAIFQNLRCLLRGVTNTRPLAINELVDDAPRHTLGLSRQSPSVEATSSLPLTTRFYGSGDFECHHIGVVISSFAMNENDIFLFAIIS